MPSKHPLTFNLHGDLVVVFRKQWDLQLILLLLQIWIFFLENFIFANSVKIIYASLKICN